MFSRLPPGLGIPCAPVVRLGAHGMQLSTVVIQSIAVGTVLFSVLFSDVRSETGWLPGCPTGPLAVPAPRSGFSQPLDPGSPSPDDRQVPQVLTKSTGDILPTSRGVFFEKQKIARKIHAPQIQGRFF